MAPFVQLAESSWNARLEKATCGREKKRFGGGSGGEPAAKRQAGGDDGPSESADEGIVVAEVPAPTPVLYYETCLAKLIEL